MRFSEKIVVLYPLFLMIIRGADKDSIDSILILFFWLGVFLIGYQDQSRNEGRVQYLRGNIVYDCLPALLLVMVNLVCFERESVSLPSLSSQAVLLISGAIWEEFLFRDVILKMVLKRMSAHKAIWIESFIFGCLHLLNAGIHVDYAYVFIQVCVAIGVGIWLSSVALKNKHIFWCLVSHICINLSSISLCADESLQINVFQSVVLLMVAVVYAFIGMTMIRQWIIKPEKRNK